MNTDPYQGGLIGNSRSMFCRMRRLPPSGRYSIRSKPPVASDVSVKRRISTRARSSWKPRMVVSPPAK